MIEGKEPGEKYITGDYTVDEKHRTVGLTEEGVLQVRAAARRRQPLRRREHRDATTTSSRRCRPTCCIQRDKDYVVQGRRGHHRRRVHRPPDARPPLVRRPAPGRRSQGRRQDRAREPDARHHHLPELLPHVQEAGRHDRYGRNRSGRVRQDLQARRHRHPDQPADDPHRDTDDIVYRTEEEKFRNAAKEIKERNANGPARAGRHHLGREVRKALRRSSRRWASGTKC